MAGAVVAGAAAMAGPVILPILEGWSVTVLASGIMVPVLSVWVEQIVETLLESWCQRGSWSWGGHWWGHQLRWCCRLEPSVTNVN